MSGEDAADLVLLSDKVLWLKEDAPDGPGFVAVRDGLICGAGAREEAARFIGGATMVRDLRRRPLAPGFVDVHAHMEVASRMRYQTVDCRAPRCATIQQVLAELRAHLDDAVDGWLVGQANLFFDQKLAEKRLPTRQELDSVSTEVAIVLRAGGHISVLNSRALELSGIDSNYQAVDHSITGLPAVIRDANGEPTGVIKEMDSLLPLPQLAREDLESAIRDGVRDQFSRFGVTTIGEISESLEGLAAMDQLHLHGDLATRVRLYMWVPGTTTLDAACAMAAEPPLSSPLELLKIHGVKMFADGGYSAASAAVKRPYVHEHGSCGDVALSPEQIAEALQRTAAAGLQLAVHANGDRAQEAVCEAIIAAGGVPHGAPTPRIEHAGNFLPEPDVTTKLWADAGIHPVPQPVFLYTFGDFFPTYLGDYGAHGRFPFRDLLDQGWPLTGSSDVWIGSEQQATNPFFSIWCTLARRTFFGELIDADQAITLTEALRMHTLNGAQILGESHLYGSLEVGKHADMIILDRDPYAVAVDELLDISVDEVFLAGRSVYSRAGSAARDES